MLLVCIREDFGVNSRNADHRDLKLPPDGTRTTIGRDYVCINSVFGSSEDGATCGICSVQWRHQVMMRVTTPVDQDSRNVTCSTWQLCVPLPLRIEL